MIITWRHPGSPLSSPTSLIRRPTVVAGITITLLLVNNSEMTARPRALPDQWLLQGGTVKSERWSKSVVTFKITEIEVYLMTVRSYYGLHQEPSQSTICNNIYNNIIKKLYEAILCNSEFRLVKFTKQACTNLFKFQPCPTSTSIHLHTRTSLFCYEMCRT